MEQAESVIFGSAEYYANRGGSTPYGFLNALYEDILHRPLDAQGAAYWGGVLDATGSNQAVALGILTSTSAYQVLVSGYYTTYLRRAADVGSAFFVTELQNGATDQFVQASIIASNRVSRTGSVPNWL